MCEENLQIDMIQYCKTHHLITRLDMEVFARSPSESVVGVYCTYGKKRSETRQKTEGLFLHIDCWHLLPYIAKSRMPSISYVKEAEILSEIQRKSQREPSLRKRTTFTNITKITRKYHSYIRFFQILNARHKSDQLKIDLLLALTVFLVVLISSMLASFYKTEEPKQDTSYTSSGTATEDLQGATIQIWKPWQLSDGRELTISIVNSNLVSQDKIDAIKDAILSEAIIKMDDPQLANGLVGVTHAYFKGWKGALESASATDSKFYIPTKFVFIEHSKGLADITIELTNLESTDGYSGYTKPMLAGDHILKTDITIYKADQYSTDRLESIVRHEFGHALGLGHSTDSEDLMYPLIDTDYPYVSQCDIDAIHSLYDGEGSGKVLCEKQ